MKPLEREEQIRREFEFGVGTISGVSRKSGVHRRMVREALNSAVPAESKPQQRRLRKLETASAFIDRVLTEDRQAPPKQQHTARRIWQRLCAEVPGFSAGERSVRGYVRRRRQQLGLLQHEVFVPQSYDWGVEAQCDWYEAYAILGGERNLDVLRKKPGALGGSTPLAQWREAGRWPECFDRLWQALNTRYGRQEGTKLMIELLSYGSREGWERLRSAVEEALSLGCQDVAAIRHLMVAGRLTRPPVAAIEIGVLLVMRGRNQC